ncbi:MAG: hypothetical protein GY696_36095 [Gammaproteobacteria bacterium]|nr:hypothetical protein [Gammaproteobacteria bacterium]
MNLLLGGSIASSMRRELLKHMNPVNFLRNHLRTNIMLSATRSTVLQRDVVQRSCNQFYEHNNIQFLGEYTRPTLDLYLCNKYWNFITKNLSAEEIADLQKAKDQLVNYEKVYTMLEYGNDIAHGCVNLMFRQATINPTVPMTIYRGSEHNSQENIVKECELLTRAYYQLLDDCKEFPEWHKKMEEEVGEEIAFLLSTIDESERDNFVASSEAFHRFDKDKQIFFR